MASKSYVAEEDENLNEEIEKIKEKYQFKEDFDLKAQLTGLPTELGLQKSRKGMRRNSEMKKIINKSIKLLKKQLDLLMDMSAQERIFLDSVPDQFAQEGYKNLQSERKNRTVCSLESDLNYFYRVLLFARVKILPDRGGRKEESRPKYIISQLLRIYIAGTNIKPKCGWDDIQSHHVGEFYNYLIDLKPVLEKLNITLSATDKSIGQYSVEILSNYRSLSDNI